MRHLPMLCAAALLVLTGCGPAAPAPSTLAADSAAETKAEPVVVAPGFLVHFEAPDPLARAQDLEAAGRCAEAEQLARSQIAARPELAGLCFNRFTVGGAEIVLEACAPVAPEAAEAFTRDWLARLNAMAGVGYAESNATAQAEDCA